MLRSYVHHDKGTDITFLGGDPIHIPKNSKAQGKHENRKKALILQNNTVRVAEYLAPNESDLSWLKDYVYLGNKEDKNLVRIAKVQDSGEFDDCSENYELTYNSTLGYQAKKKR